jgi:hypothetical protein
MVLGIGLSTNSMGGVGEFAKEMAARALKPRHAGWKEEVLLHDGRKLIVERTQAYGGYPAIESPDRELLHEEWVFRIPDNGQKAVWKSDFRRPPEGDSLMLLQLNFLKGVPYVATSPAGCLSYNHWKRPNPPYVFFRYDGKTWKQIPLAEFPAVFRESNVVVGRPDPDHREGLLSVDMVKEENRLLEPYLKQIVREPLKPGAVGVSCPDYSSPRYMSPKAPNPIKPIPKEMGNSN